MNPDTRSPAARLASFSVGDWLIEPKACLASRESTTVKLRPQLIDLLLCLARRPGEIVLKEEILAEVWPGQYIADSGLSRCIAELRQLLCDDAQHPRFIETIPKRGYRLVAPVARVESETGIAAAVETPAAVGRRRVTWSRRAWPVLAVLSAAVVALFVFKRPPAPVVTIRDTVLLADVKNETGDRVFDETLRLALAVNLEQAPFLRIVPQEAVRGALLRSGRSADERVVGPVALDVCRREGAAVLLAGSIASLGSRYVVGLEAFACPTGDAIGRAMTEAGGKEGVLAALEQAASRIRHTLGESRESLSRYDVPLVRATTPSLEALKALTLGEVQRDAGRHEKALPYFRQATKIDPEFALAWARRGVTARNLGLRAEAVPAIRRAFELVDRVSQPERFFIESIYYRLVEGDLEKAIESNREWKRTYPGASTPANSLASILSDEMGRYDEAVREAREAVRLAPSTGMPYDNLAQACIGAGQYAEARKAVAEATRRGLDDWGLHILMLVGAQAEGDQAAIERETNWPINYPPAALVRLQLRAAAAAGAGRLGDARRLWADASHYARQVGGDLAVLETQVIRAQAEAVLGNPVAARNAVLLPEPAASTPLLLVHAAITMALADDFARAHALLREASRMAVVDPAPLRVWLPTVEALIAARQGRADEALRILQPVTRFERGADFGQIPLAVRGIACASGRRPVEAAAAFSDLVRLPGVADPAWLAFARLNLARAMRDAGDKAASLAAYDAFLDAWKHADGDAPLLAAARRERAAVAAR